MNIKVLIIGADWCQACKSLWNSIVPKVHNHYQHVEFNYLDCEKNADEVSALGINISSLPATVIFKDDEVYEIRYGIMNNQELEKILRHTIKGD